jgi:uncharacterized membrane protein HdeD (DUF308 family)
MKKQMDRIADRLLHAGLFVLILGIVQYFMQTASVVYMLVVTGIVLLLLGLVAFMLAAWRDFNEWCDYDPY